MAETLLQRLEKQFPGIRKCIEYFEVATPKTMRRYTLNPKGAVYGYAQTPQQSGDKRLRNNFLIPNLYFASAWAFPGGGFAGAISGGFLTALKMWKEATWSECSAVRLSDERMVPLIEKKDNGNPTLELSFEKPTGFSYKKGQDAILKLIDPEVTELDVTYRWLPIVSHPEEPALKFTIPPNKSSFNKSCNLLKIGEKALVFGPME